MTLGISYCRFLGGGAISCARGTPVALNFHVGPDGTRIARWNRFTLNKRSRVGPISLFRLCVAPHARRRCETNIFVELLSRGF